jgi:BolA protein
VSSREEQIAALLVDRLQPLELRIKDQSHLHAGHAGASDGRGHFDVFVVSGAFAGKSRIQRHQLVYSALAELMKSDIHALKIKALAPDEV